MHVMNKLLKNIRKPILFFILASITVSLSAYRDDDTGELIEAETWSDNITTYYCISDLILDENGNLRYTPSVYTPGLYVFPVENARQSLSICEGFIGREWDGNDTKISLGKYGSITLRKSSVQGVFNEIDFNLTDRPVFTLRLATPQHCRTENAYMANFKPRGLYMCNHCKKKTSQENTAKCKFCCGTSFSLVAN